MPWGGLIPGGGIQLPPYQVAAPLPEAPQQSTRSPGWLGGLMGQSPYAQDLPPEAQQGLMHAAMQQFGLQLLANAQNPNIGQGLAQAFAAAQQASSTGAREAHQIARQKEQDAQREEYVKAQSAAAEELANRRRDAAEAERRALAESESGRAQMAAELEEAGFKDAGLWTRKRVEDAHKRLVEKQIDDQFKEEKKAILRSGASPIVRENPDGTFDVVYTPPPRPDRPPPPPPPPTGRITEARVATRVAQLLDRGDAQTVDEAREMVMAEIDATREVISDQDLMKALDEYVPPPPQAAPPPPQMPTPPPAPTPPPPPQAAAPAQEPNLPPETAEIAALVQANPQLQAGVMAMIEDGVPPAEILKAIRSRIGG